MTSIDYELDISYNEAIYEKMKYVKTLFKVEI